MSGHKKNMRVLIPDGESVMTPLVINCLSVDKRVEIHLLSSKKWVESRFSRHISSFTFLPDHGSEEDRFTFITGLIESLDINVILPTIVHGIGFVSKFKEGFKQYGVNVVVPQVEHLNLANCKWSLSQFLDKHKFPHPKTKRLNSKQSVNGLRFPILIKPLSAWNGRGIRRIDSGKEVDSIDFNNEELLAQELLIGDDYCVNVLCDAGKVIQHTMQKGIISCRHDFRSKLGAKFITNRKLLDLIEDVIEEMNWTGIANFDILKEKKSGNFHIIEMNPRFWGSVEASQRVGVNFPVLLAKLSIGETVTFSNFKQENYISNKGIVEIIFYIITLQWNKIDRPQNHSLGFFIADPIPKIFKYLDRVLLRLFRSSKNPNEKKGLNKSIIGTG